MGFSERRATSDEGQPGPALRGMGTLVAQQRTYRVLGRWPASAQLGERERVIVEVLVLVQALQLLEELVHHLGPDASATL